MSNDTEISSMSPASFKAKYTFVIKLGMALHKFGIQAFRLEAELTGISELLGLEGSFLATPTSLTFVLWSPDKENEHTHVVRVQPGNIDLGKLADVNQVVQDLKNETLTVVQAYIRLNEIENCSGLYSNSITLIAFGASSAGFAMMIGLDWFNIAWASALGVVCYLLVFFAGYSQRLSTVLEPLTSVVNGILAMGINHLDPGLNVPLVILSSIIIFIPGLSITLGLSELAARELMSGTARVMDAVMLLFKLYFGAVLGLAIGSLIWGKTFVPVVTAMPFWSKWLGVLLLSSTLGVVFNVRTKDIGWAIFSGLLAYVATLMGSFVLGSAMGNFIGAFAVGVYGNLYALFLKSPASVVLLTGIVVLVPGSKTYMGLDNVIADSIATQPNIGSETFLIFMSLVAGLIFANIVISPRQSL